MTQDERAAALDALQARIDHRFADPALLDRALTHSSVSGHRDGGRDLERLEFLGDRVLGLMTAEALWRTFPSDEEGDLAVRLNALVRKETCAAAARAFGLAELIILSKSEEAGGGRKKTAILGDVCEAFLGALYIDGGLPAAAKAFDLYWRPRLRETRVRAKDAKTTLQEWAQSHGAPPPAYQTVTAEGPSHAPAFEIEVRVDGRAPALGSGPSKRKAQQAAAEALLIREGVWRDD